jgi:hypothetical protein
MRTCKYLITKNLLIVVVDEPLTDVYFCTSHYPVTIPIIFISSPAKTTTWKNLHYKITEKPI